MSIQIITRQTDNLQPSEPQIVRYAQSAIDAAMARWDREAIHVRRAASTITPRVEPARRVLTPEQQAETARLLGIVETETPQGLEADCPNNSYKDIRNRTTRTTYCYRAQRVWVQNAEGEPVARFLPCRSRTCKDCRAGLDQSDAERLTDAIGTRGYVVEIDKAQWDTVYKRLRRAGATGARIPSTRTADALVVVADIPPTPDATPVADVAVLTQDLCAHRPTGLERRLTTFGGVKSRDEWENRPSETAIDGETDWMARTVQPDDVERLAVAVGVPFERTGSTIRLRCRWDDWRAVAIRKWAKNPSGDAYEKQRRDTLIKEGVYGSDDPPDEAYEEAV